MVRRNIAQLFCRVNGWLVFLFLTLAVTLPTSAGYSYAPALLLLLSLSLCLPAVRAPLRLDAQDKGIIGIMALYALAHLLVIALDEQTLRAFDRPSKFLLGIPILCLLLTYPPRPAFLWWGAIIGSASAGLIALTQKVLLHDPSASAWMMPIQFAALVMVLACVSFTSMGYFLARHHRFGIVAGAIGGLLGLIAAFLSGTRGAWLVIPFALLIFALAYRELFSKRIWFGIGSAFLLTTIVIVSVPESGVTGRIASATAEAKGYLDKGDVRSSVGARLEMWKTSLDMIPEHPWLGWGQKGYEAEIRRRVASKETSEFILSFSHAHSEMIDAQVKRGLLGLLTLLALYTVPALWFMRRAFSSTHLEVRTAALAGLFLPLVFFFSGLTQALFSHNSGVTFFSAMLAVTWANMRHAERLHQPAH